jgi:chromosome segregation protein
LYLKRLEIQGFKSFADRIKLEFAMGITSIVGPNGSGKSNISDAVRWVLGEQSAKSLRGSKMEDVIFSGTEHRKASGLAEVTLIIDNHDGALPLDYAEVSVTRRVYRSGESEYLINRNHCRLKDVYEAFFDTGIGREGYTLIGQGKVDEILNNKPEERRGIFEEAAGITKYKTRKSEAERKLDATARNLLRISDIVAELEAQLDVLQGQAAGARRYLKLKEELKAVEISAFTASIARCLAEQEKSEAGFALERAELERREKALLGAEAHIAEKNRRGEELDGAHDALRDDLMRIESRLANAAGAVTLNNEKADRAGESIGRLRAEIAGAGERRAAQSAELGANEKKLEHIVSEIARYEELRDGKQAEYGRLLSSLGASDRATEALKRQAADMQERYYARKSAQGALESELAHFGKNRTAIDRNIQLARDELKTDTGERERLLAEKAAADGRLAGLRERQAQLAAERARQARSHDELSAAIQSKAAELNAKKARAKILSDLENSMEGFYASVKRVLSQCRASEEFGRGIFGAVATLITAPKPYVTAISMALGSAAQNIVTADEESAKRAIAFLKRTSGGRATFMPLTSVKGGKLDRATLGKLSAKPGFVGLASDLIEYGAEYEPAVAQLLGRTCVVDGIDNAVRLARENRYAFRIVTLEGDILTTGGAITGGSVEARDSGILSRHSEIPELHGAAAALESELRAAEGRRAACAGELEAAARGAAQAERDINACNIEAVAAASKLSHLDEKIKAGAGRLEMYGQELREAREREGELGGEISAIEAETGGLARELAGKTAEIARLGEKSKEGQRATDELRDEISGYNVSMASIAETRKAILDNISRIKSDMRQGEMGVKAKGAEIAKLEGDIESLRGENAALEGEIRAAASEKQGKSLRLESFAAEKAALREEIQEATEAMAALAAQIADIQKELGRHEARAARIGAELENCRNRLWEEYELTYHNALEQLSLAGAGAAATAADSAGAAGTGAGADGDIESGGEDSEYNDVGAASEAGENGDDGEDSDDGAAAATGANRAGKAGTGGVSGANRAAALKEEIRALGFVNVLAIEEYSATKARHEKMRGAQEDMQQAGEKLQKVIEEMSDIMRRTFREQFALINENFNTVFQELFEGGTARLILTEGKNVLEAGVEIEIQFPGKRMQNMMLYSGGERAMTAIALIFAILKLKPAPFCLLDEIESALDEANVDRFARYIGRYCDMTQFIMVTHRKGTMEASNALYGVTMQEKGVSGVVSLKLSEAGRHTA